MIKHTVVTSALQLPHQRPHNPPHAHLRMTSTTAPPQQQVLFGTASPFVCPGLSIWPPPKDEGALASLDSRIPDEDLHWAAKSFL